MIDRFIERFAKSPRLVILGVGLLYLASGALLFAVAFSKYEVARETRHILR